MLIWKYLLGHFSGLLLLSLPGAGYTIKNVGLFFI